MLLEHIDIATPTTVSEITTLDGLERLHDEWTELWIGAPHATPFQSPAWLLPCARRWVQRSLWILAIRADDTLVGLAPFFIYEHAQERARTVVLLGNGVSDYLDVLAAPGWDREVAHAVFAHLHAQRDRWDHCDWQQLRPTSPLLAHPPAPQWGDRLRPNEPCPVLTIPTDRPIEAALSPHFAERLRYDRCRLDRDDPLTFEEADARTLPSLLEELRRLHGARWTMQGTPGMLANEAVCAFHRDAAQEMLALGILRLHAVRRAGRVVACTYGFLHRGRAYYYLGGFDPDLAREGIGNQSVLHAIVSAQREGATAFDFLRGREPYKYRWGAADSPTFQRSLHQ